jgi:hypothetical protein
MKMPYDTMRGHSPLRPRLLCGLVAVAWLGAVACVSPISDPPNGEAGSNGGPPGSNNPPSGTSGNSGSVGGSNGAGDNPGTGARTNAPGGSTSNPGTGGTSTMPDPMHTTPPPVGGELSNCTTPGPRLIRRLTSVQLRNTLVDAFNDPNVPTTDIFADPFLHRFRVDADIPVVRDLDAGLIMHYAETVADWAVRNKLDSLIPPGGCKTLTDQNCRRQLIQNAGLKLNREPVTDARVAGYDKLYVSGTTKTFEEFATDVIATMVQSPYFIYRRELGTQEGGAYKLTPYEVASELSYFLTDSAPDQPLMEAAKNGRLATPADIDAQATRLLATPGGRRTLEQFVGGWLEIDGLRTKTKDPNIFILTPELRESMIDETEKTFIDAFDNGGDVAKLLTTKKTFVDQPLAAFYGITASGTVDVPPMRPPGVLGQAAFLAHHAQPENSSALQRGLAIRARFLCEKIPEVPKDLNTTLAPGDSFTTSRERFSQHSRDPVCATCHRAFDPVGFVFENFDGFGRYRTEEKDEQGVSHPIDATGTLHGVPEGNLPLNGPQSLIDYLAASDIVRACVVRWWSYYAHGRDNWAEKKCNDDSVRRESGMKGNSLKSVLMGILHAPSFTRRVKEPQ